MPITCVVVAEGCLLVQGVQLQEFLIVGPLRKVPDIVGGLVKLLQKITIMVVNPLKSSGHYMYRTVVTICTASLTFTILRSAHTVYLCVLFGSQNKQRLFPYTTLTDWFV